jgi:hypothetical protein
VEQPSVSVLVQRLEERHQAQLWTTSAHSAVDGVVIAQGITASDRLLVVVAVAVAARRLVQQVRCLSAHKVSVEQTKQVASVVAVVVLVPLVLVATVEQVLTLQDSSAVPHYSSAVAVAVEQ